MKHKDPTELLARYRRISKDQAIIINRLNKELEEIRTDRNKFREHFANRYKWWWKLLNDKQTPSLLWLAEDDSKMLRTLKWWPL